MQIFINDTPTECGEQTSISGLLSQQGIPPVNIAVAMDNTVVPKAQWDETMLTDGSHIIIIKAVQGG